MKLFITRHGETEWNIKGKVCGVSDVPLTDRGINQAKKLAEQLKRDKEKNNIKTIYVSPLIRARQTAKFIEEALDLKAIPDARLQEVNFGEFEGKFWKLEEFDKIKKNPFMRFPEGESLLMTAGRVYSLIEEVKNKHAGQDGNILFVCHGLVSKLSYTFFKNFSYDEFYKLYIDNCELLEFDLEDFDTKKQ